VNRAGVDRRAMATLSLCHLFTDVSQGSVPALLPFLIARDHIDYAAASALILAVPISSSVIQPLFGHVSDRLSLPWLMPLGPALGGLGIALVGLAPSYPLILAAVVLSGVGVAAFHPEGSRFANYVSGTRRASGMSLFSVGGNVGFFATQLAQLTENLGIHVFSFEPSPFTFTHLAQGVRRLGLQDRVHPVCCALSDAPGLVHISEDERETMRAHLVSAGSQGGPGQTVAWTNCVTLDEVLRSVPTAPSLITGLEFFPVPPCRVADTRPIASFPTPFGTPTPLAGDRLFTAHTRVSLLCWITASPGAVRGVWHPGPAVKLELRLLVSPGSGSKRSVLGTNRTGISRAGPGRGKNRHRDVHT